MAKRKLRVNLSSGYYKKIPAIVDIDINMKNVDIDLEVTDEGLIKEYTFDATDGIALVDIVYRDESHTPHKKRNLIINSIEVANEGEDYQVVFPGPDNCSQPPLWQREGAVRNPDFDDSKPATDDIPDGVDPDPWTWDPGSNPAWIETFWHEPITVYLNGPVEFKIDLPVDRHPALRYISSINKTNEADDGQD